MRPLPVVFLNRSKHAIIVFILLLQGSSSYCQETIYIQNPSFEAHKIDQGDNFACLGWLSMKQENNSPPTIHSKRDRRFKVCLKPSDGKYFLGFVTRYDSTWESILQRLSTPLKGGRTYSFSIDLCTSKTMKSATKRTSDEERKRMVGDTKLENFDKGAILRIQGSSSKTGANEILAQSTVITNIKWENSEFILKPTADYDVLIIEAFFDLKKEPDPYRNGNILIDNCSHITLQDD